MSKLYLVLTHSNTIPSYVIRKVTHSYWNHVSFSLDKELESMRSFCCYHLWALYPAGYVKEGKHIGIFKHLKRTICRVYEVELDERQYKQVSNLIKKMDSEPKKYRFNYLGLATYLLGKYHDGKGKYFCTEFIGHLLYGLGLSKFKKRFSRLIPEDFVDLDGFKLVYEGKYQEYEYPEIMSKAA